MNVFTRMAARIRGSGKRGDMNEKMGGKIPSASKPSGFSEMVKDAQSYHVDVKLTPFGRLTLTMIEARKVSERLFNARTVARVSKHANDEGVTLLFIDGTRGDVEACDAVEILKYMD